MCNHKNIPVPVKQPGRIWLNQSYKFGRTELWYNILKKGGPNIYIFYGIQHLLPGGKPNMSSMDDIRVPSLILTDVQYIPWSMSLHWRHNDHDGVSNHQPQSCLLNRLFRRRSRKTSKLRVTGHCAGNSPGPVNSPHKWPVTRKMFPFDNVIMAHSFLHLALI